MVQGNRPKWAWASARRPGRVAMKMDLHVHLRIQLAPRGWSVKQRNEGGLVA